MSGLLPILCVSMTLFAIGVSCMLVRKGAPHALMGLVLILNASALNFVAFARLAQDPIDGTAAAVLVLVVALAEVALALAILMHLARADRE